MPKRLLRVPVVRWSSPGSQLPERVRERIVNQEERSEILVGWIASPVHRQNLYAPPWNATGIGVAQGADGSFYYTQLYLTYPR